MLKADIDHLRWKEKYKEIKQTQIWRTTNQLDSKFQFSKLTYYTPWYLRWYVYRHNPAHGTRHKDGRIGKWASETYHTDEGSHKHHPSYTNYGANACRPFAGSSSGCQRYQVGRQEVQLKPQDRGHRRGSWRRQRQRVGQKSRNWWEVRRRWRRGSWGRHRGRPRNRNWERPRNLPLVKGMVKELGLWRRRRS